MDETKRPWGHYVTIRKDKLLYINPDSKLSLQYHKNRTEFWTVLEGEGFVEINGLEQTAWVGDYFTIKPGEEHRIMTKDLSLLILEKAVGNVEEDDITRVEDQYGRA